MDVHTILNVLEKQIEQGNFNYFYQTAILFLKAHPALLTQLESGRFNDKKLLSYFQHLQIDDNEEYYEIMTNFSILGVGFAPIGSPIFEVSRQNILYVVQKILMPDNMMALKDRKLLRSLFKALNTPPLNKNADIVYASVVHQTALSGVDINALLNKNEKEPLQYSEFYI